MPNTHTTLSDLFEAIADAIRAKTGSSDPIVADEFPDAISEIESESVDLFGDVLFVDFDGTPVKVYTAKGFLDQVAMPACPTRDGFTSQGWNWTLAEAQSYVKNHGRLIVGHQCITSDNKTRLYIHLTSGATVTMKYTQAAALDVDVDWGDSSSPSGSATVGEVTASHTYATAGDYTITLTGSVSFKSALFAQTIQAPNTFLVKAELGTVPELESAFQFCKNLIGINIPQGTEFSAGGTFNYASIRVAVVPRSSNIVQTYTFADNACLELVSLPGNMSGMSLRIAVFENCEALKRIMLPDGLTRPNTSAFDGCTALVERVMPVSATLTSNYSARNCTSLESADIPDGVSTVGNGSYLGCTSLVSVTIPSSVTKLNNEAFKDCSSLVAVHMQGSTPPTLGTDVFSGVANGCVIYVPVGSLTTYQAASGWSSIASMLQEEAT